MRDEDGEVVAITAVLTQINASSGSPDALWVDFIAHLWPLARRYRVLVVLRRGEYGAEIHALLRPVDKSLADLVHRGQEREAFGRHLPADILSQVAFSSVFAIAENESSGGALGVRAATITSLLILGVSDGRASALVDGRIR